MKASLLALLLGVVLVVVPAAAQDRMSDSSASGIPVGSPESQRVDSPEGVITFFGDRPTFDAAHPGLPCEGWELFTNNIVGCDAPANSTTSCPGGYNVGDILPGLEIDSTANSGPGGNGLVIIPAGFDGNASIVFGSNFFVDGTIVNTNPAVRAIGLDIQCHFGSPSVNVDVFDGLGALVASAVSSCANAGTFLGMESNAIEGIGSVVITDPSGASVESTDNVCFGEVPFPVELMSYDVD